jgi:hypothetical protein
MPDIRIEYPSQGQTYCRNVFGVYEYSRHNTGVLRGRQRRVFLDSFDTLAEAQAAFPKADATHCPGYVEDQMLDLPGEDDAQDEDSLYIMMPRVGRD